MGRLVVDGGQAQADGGGVGRRRVAPPAGFVAVEDELGALLFFFDPVRDLVQVKLRGRLTLVDLRMYRGGGVTSDELRVTSGEGEG